MQNQSKINSIFSQLELQGVDTCKELLYGYFFFEKDKSNLEKLGEQLAKDGYKVVRLEKTEDEQTYLLHVEKVEIHSRESLQERESHLRVVCKNFNIATYDGWDVGNADPAKPLITIEQFSEFLDKKTTPDLYESAVGLYKNQIYKFAIIAFQKCIEKGYNIEDSLYKQGVSYHCTEQNDMAIRKFKEVIEINPLHLNALFNLGAIYYDVQEYQKSVEYYQKAAEIYPNNTDIYYGIAASQFVLKQFQDSMINCQKALQADPNNRNASMLMESLKKKLG